MGNSGRNAVLAVISLAALVFAGYRLIGGSGNKKLIVSKTNSAQVVCLACKAENPAVVDAREVPPYECPACQQRAAITWMYCYECNKRFVPALVRREGKTYPTPFPYCTSCNCQAVAPFDPENPGQTPVGDAKLPAWP